MHSAPVPADGGRDDSQPGTPPGPDQDPPGAGDAWEPVITRPDPMTEEERQAWLDALDEPFDPEEYPDPDGPPPPGEDELALDVMPGGPDLAMLADAAAGDDDRYPDTSDDELIGVLCAGPTGRGCSGPPSRPPPGPPRLTGSPLSLGALCEPELRHAVQLCRKAASLAATSARNMGCRSIDGEYLLAGTSRPRASAMART